MLNIHAFRKEKFFSHTIGVLSFVLHEIPLAGTYVIRVKSGDRAVREIGLTCLDDEPNTQVNIDLATSATRRVAEKSDLRIRTNGRLLLYSSQGTTEHRVTIALKNDSGAEKTVFDSEQLGKSDLVIINPVLPGEYTLATGSTPKAGKITVAKARDGGLPVSQLEPKRAVVEERGMTPPAVELLPGQPLILESPKPVRFDVTRKPTRN